MQSAPKSSSSAPSASTTTSGTSTPGTPADTGGTSASATPSTPAAPTPPSTPAPPATPTTPSDPAPPDPTPPPAPVTPAAPPASSPLPTPPANAIVFSALESRTNWGSCNTADCSGGSGKGSYWMAQNQTAPALDGASLQVYSDGVWGDALWWLKLGAHNDVSNFLWDFYFQLDANSLASGQAIEFDAFQFIGGYRYMMGTQCDYGYGVWDIWDELNQHWIHTSIACPKFAPNTWHHVQWYFTRDTATRSYTFVTLVVDGTAYQVNRTESASYFGWNDNLGIQYQLDVNASGAGYSAWFDRSTLTAW